MSISEGLKPKTLDGRLVLIHDSEWMSSHCTSFGSYSKGNLSYRLDILYDLEDPEMDFLLGFFVYLNQKDMGIIGRQVRLELVRIIGKTPLYRCRRPMADGEDLVYDCQISEDFVEHVYSAEYESSM